MMPRTVRFLVSAAVVSAAALLAQTGDARRPTTPIIPSGTIKGSEHPELIPDEAALKVFLLAVCEPSAAATTQRRRLRDKLSPIGLDDRDRDSMVLDIHGFADAYQTYDAEGKAISVRVAQNDPQAMADRRALVGKIDQLVLATQSALFSHMTERGRGQFKRHLQEIKKRMWIIPPPDMSEGHDNHGRTK